MSPIVVLMVLVGMLAASSPVQATTFANAEEQRVRIEQYSVNQGLVQNTVSGLVEDADGFLWIATGGGLNRFDGHRFQLIEGPDGAFLNSYISALNITANGTLWLAIPNKGVFSLLPDAAEFEKRIDAELIDEWWFSEITEIFEHRGALYFINDNSMRRFDETSNEITELFTLEQKSTTHYDVIRDAIPYQEFIFIASTDGVTAYNLNDNSATAIPHVSATSVHYTQRHAKALYILSGKLFIGAVQGLYTLPLDATLAHLRHDAEAPTPTDIDAALNVWEMAEHQGRLLLATHTGYYQHSPGTAQVDNVLRFTQSNLPVYDNSVHHLLVDRDDNVWLGTWFNGLFYWRPSTTLFTTIAQGKAPFAQLSNNQVWALAQDVQGRLWAGTQNGLNLLDHSAEGFHHEVFFTAEDSSPYLHEGVVYDIFPDPYDADTIWLYIADYVYRFTPSSGVKTPLAELVNNEADAEVLGNYFWGYNLIGDELWFADADALYTFHTQTYELKQYQEFSDADFNPLNLYLVSGSRPDHPEQLFLSLASELWLFNRNTNEVTRLYRHEPFNLYADRYVESIVEDHQQRLWMTLIGGGLIVFDKNSLEHLFSLDQSDGLPVMYLYQGHVDTQGGLWFSSMAGLIHINPDTLHAQQFGYRDGVSSNEFNYAASTKLADGRLAYGSMRGITMFNPLTLTAAVPEINARISSVSDVTTGTRLKLPLTNLDRKHLTLAHDNRGIRVDVSSGSFDRPQEVRYHYQLQGPEPLSIRHSSDASIALPRLRPGHYSLSVRAISPSSGETSAPAKMSIHVSHPPLTSPFALTLYAIALSVILIAFIYYRMEQHRRLRNSKLAAERSEERLQLAISATKSGIWDWHRENDRLYETRVGSELGYPDIATRGLTLAQYRQYIHRRDLPQLTQQWLALIRGERDELNCSYRARDRHGNWVWFKDIGHVTARDHNGRVERVTGVYQNITKARSDEEKALLFGKAFEQTQDWVLLLNAEQMPVTANRAFYEAIGITENALDNFDFVQLSEERLGFYRDVLKRMKPGEQWRGEEMARLANGKRIPVLVNISAVADTNSASRAFVIVINDISAQKEAEQQLRQLANYDVLTGLPNRSLLNQELDELLAKPTKEAEQLALMFMDLDRFKQINDTHGHNVGDNLLCVIAERLKACVRDTDIIARLGGDEFIILLSAPSELAIESTAQRIIDAVNEPMIVDKHHLRVSPSIGIAYYPQHGHSRDELIKNADVAMYEAKDNGRNCIKVFQTNMDSKVRERLNLEVELKHAVTHNQLQNHYQPIVNAAKEQCVGVELLLRWPLRNKLIAPDVFVPLAEDLGLIVTITEAALRQALADLKRFRELHPTLYLSVNLSVRHLDHETLPQHLKELLNEFNLPPSALRFELTEGILIEETQRAKHTMTQLRELGITLMLDDFGTGYSSLRYLKEFPIDVIKIDRGFTMDIGHDSSDEAIIESILAMASNLDKVCIAEGVESKAQRRWLLARGCHLMQGFLYSPALKATEMERWLFKQQRVAKHHH